jgi:hypothetical protein
MLNNNLIKKFFLKIVLKKIESIRDQFIVKMNQNKIKKFLKIEI